MYASHVAHSKVVSPASVRLCVTERAYYAPNKHFGGGIIREVASEKKRHTYVVTQGTVSWLKRMEIAVRMQLTQMSHQI
eukprot:scaffold115490_cov33-Prasinocladus_malaysianus.AAC.1